MSTKINTSIKLGLPNTPNTRNPELYTQLAKMYDAANRLAQEETQNTRTIAVFAQDVVAGQLVYLHSVAGVLTASLANATDGTKPAYGFTNSIVSSGTAGEVMHIGLNPFGSALTISGICYLGLTDGSITQTKPNTAGNIVQPVGFAISTTSVFFNPSYNWTQL